MGSRRWPNPTEGTPVSLDKIPYVIDCRFLAANDNTAQIWLALSDLVMNSP